MRPSPLIIDESRSSLIQRAREARAAEDLRAKGEALDRFRRDREEERRRTSIATWTVAIAVIGLAAFVLLHAGGAR